MQAKTKKNMKGKENKITLEICSNKKNINTKKSTWKMRKGKKPKLELTKK